MYTVKGHGIVWDAEKNKPLIRFEDGVATTEDEATASKLKALGYEVDEMETPAETDISKMTVKELKEYAAEKGINLGEASAKQDILACIAEAEKPKE